MAVSSKSQGPDQDVCGYQTHTPQPIVSMAMPFSQSDSYSHPDKLKTRAVIQRTIMTIEVERVYAGCTTELLNFVR